MQPVQRYSAQLYYDYMSQKQHLVTVSRQDYCNHLDLKALYWGKPRISAQKRKYIPLQ